jgi:hypothetical protein
VIPEDVRSFLAREVESTWMLDLLCLLKSTAPRTWSADELILEMRGSRFIIENCLGKLASLGTIMIAGRHISYTPSNPHDQTITKLARIYAEQPLAVIRETLSTPHDKIQSFADAFKFKP